MNRISSIIFALLFLTSCSLVTIRSDQCDAIRPAEGINLAFCGELAEYKRKEWLEWTPQVAMAMDEALASLGMPPVTEHLDGTLIRIYDAPSDGEYAGVYLGYDEPETKTIEIYLKPEWDEPRTSALAHEWFHLYDHHRMKLTRNDWLEIANAAPYQRHFSAPIIADYVIKNARAAGMSDQDPPLTRIQQVVCPGPHMYEEE